MKIERGSSRICIVTESYTLKIPRLRLGVFHNISFIIKRRRLGCSWEKIGISVKNNLLQIFQRNLANIQSNVQEYRLGKKFPEIVMKTRLSVFGLINIQDTGQIVSESEIKKIWEEMIQRANNYTLFQRESHTYYEGKNLAFDSTGKVKLIDAGSRTMGDTLEKERDAIINSLVIVSASR